MPNDFHQLFGYAAGALTLAAYVPYIRSIVRGATRPNRASWFIWTSADVVAALSYSAVGAGATRWMALGYVAGSAIVALLSLKYGVKGWTAYDRWCLVGAGCAIALWIIFDNPLLALIASLTTIGFGVLPTYRKVQQDPASENFTAWTLYMLGALANIFAIDRWLFGVMLYPITFFVVESPIYWHLLKAKCPQPLHPACPTELSRSL